MPLPTIEHPRFKVTVPSTKQEISMRPFLVKEEKILLVAREEGSLDAIVSAILDILSNCIFDEDFDVGALTSFDVEYMFLKLRARSVNEIIELRYKDNEDEKERTFEVNLNDVELEWPKNAENTITVPSEHGDLIIELQYPSFNDYRKLTASNETTNTDVAVLLKAYIKSIWYEDESYDLSQETDEDIVRFFDQFPTDVLDKVKKFHESRPVLRYDIVYENENENERIIELRGLADFFG